MNAVQNYYMDMDGVLVSGQTMIPGAAKFIKAVRENGAEYLVLTNNPLYTPRDLAHRLQTIGLEVPEKRIFTSAMATVDFLQEQTPGGSAFVIGETGLTTALHDAGYVITDVSPDYVILGETHAYNYEMITKAVRLIAHGARFIATNPDPSGPSEHGIVPACGAMAALIREATGAEPYFVGKPNPLMMRMALNRLGLHSENTIMVGDRMETDIKAGLESGMETILVLTGVTQRDEIARYPYQPTRVVDSVADIEL
jgi:NagD protein